MIRKWIVPLLFLCFTRYAGLASDTLQWKIKEGDGYRLHYTPADASGLASLVRNLAAGREKVTLFFDQPFRKSFDVYVFPDRASLDRQWEKDWKLPGFKSECWMVASGTASRLDLLSPNSWARDACEHRSSDSNAVQQIITHELTHVFHGQQNPVGGFDDMDEMAWLIEGLATYASGQLTEQKLKQVRDSIAAGRTPASLGECWTGNLRYPRAGSIVRYIDRTYGRKKLYSLLAYTQSAGVLAALGTTEGELLGAWKREIILEF